MDRGAKPLSDGTQRYGLPLRSAKRAQFERRSLQARENGRQKVEKRSYFWRSLL